MKGLFLASIWLLCSPALLSGSTTTHSKFIGTYISDSHESAKVTTSMELSLGSDGTATITEDSGNGTTTLFGHWVDAGSQVKVMFDEAEGKPVEPAMVFQPGRGGLQAITWNHSTWGNAQPPPMKNKARVKQRLTHGNSSE